VGSRVSLQAYARGPTTPARFPLTLEAMTGFAQRHPIVAFAVGAIAPTWAVQLLFLARGWPLFPAFLLELVFLVGSAVVVTARTEGRPGVRNLFAGVLRWRFGLGRLAFVLLAMPASTLLIAAVSGSLRNPDGGWGKEIAGYLFLTLIFGAVLGNVWEETAWAGFAQRRLMDRHGLLVGSVLTAIPFALIHLPMALEGGPGARDLAISWAALILTAPVLRYLLGTVMIDTGGSVLAVAILHASFNSTQQLGALHGQWQIFVALPLLTLLVAVTRGSTTADTRQLDLSAR